MNQHPNTVVGGVSGLSGGALTLYLLSLFGLHVDEYAAGAIFVAASSVALFIGRNGIVGVWKRLLHGTRAD